jgi:hypothetical protein
MPTYPSTKPKAPRELVLGLAEAKWAQDHPNLTFPTHLLVGVRGYRAESMGPTKNNDVNIFDDAAFLITPSQFLSENINTDPTRYGWNAGAGKPMAVLQPGCWPFYPGPHKGVIPALRQFSIPEAKLHNIPKDGKFVVKRTYAPNDERNYLDEGYFAINHHYAGFNTTSSEGCITYPRHTIFLPNVYNTAKDLKTLPFWFILLDGPII